MLLISAMESEENIGTGLSQGEALRLARDKALDQILPYIICDQLFSPDGDQIFIN